MRRVNRHGELILEASHVDVFVPRFPGHEPRIHAEEPFAADRGPRERPVERVLGFAAAQDATREPFAEFHFRLVGLLLEFAEVIRGHELEVNLLLLVGVDHLTDRSADFVDGIHRSRRDRRAIGRVVAFASFDLLVGPLVAVVELDVGALALALLLRGFGGLLEPRLRQLQRVLIAGGLLSHSRSAS